MFGADKAPAPTPERSREAWGDLVLLALVVWREARGESYRAKLAVAHVAVTRTRRPGYRDVAGYSWGDGTMLSVLFSPWQFSSVSDPRDAQLTKWPRIGTASWSECLAAAEAAVTGSEPAPLPGADCYHDTTIQRPPSWRDKVLLGSIDNLVFYRTP